MLSDILTLLYHLLVCFSVVVLLPLLVLLVVALVVILMIFLHPYVLRF